MKKHYLVFVFCFFTISGCKLKVDPIADIDPSSKNVLLENQRISKKFANLAHDYDGDAFRFVNSNEEQKYIEDSLNLNDIISSAKWFTYCLACFDTVFYSQHAVSLYWYPSFRPLSNMNYILKRIYATKINSDLNNKEYEIVLGPDDPLFDSSGIVLPYKGKKRYYEFYVFFHLSFLYRQQHKPIAFSSVYGHICNFVKLNEKIEYKFVYERSCVVRRAIKICLNPFQPDIIKYVRDNQNIIHPWFLNEAKQRGMFDSIKYNPVWIDLQIRADNSLTDDCLSSDFLND
jgi:hypothetical protein